MIRWWLATTLLGCGSPVVDPGRTTTPISPPVVIPAPANSSGLPTLDMPEIQRILAESVLNLPSESNSATYHSVNAGETLASIAKRYGVSAEKLRMANGLDAAAKLNSQQLLYIPKDR
jgi:LysM repeat protein